MTNGLIYVGSVVELTADGPLVLIPQFAPRVPFGPLPTLVADLDVGERVAVSNIGQTQNAYIVLGRMSPRAPTQEEIPGLDTRLDSIEATDVTQDGRLTAVEGVNGTQNTRLTAVEGANTTQDGRLTTVEGRATTVENRATAVENRATAIEGVNTTQNGRLDAVEAKNTTQDTRLTAAEGAATALTTRVGNAETAATSLTGRVTAAEGTAVTQGNRVTALETANQIFGSHYWYSNAGACAPGTEYVPPGYAAQYDSGIATRSTASFKFNRAGRWALTAQCFSNSAGEGIMQFYIQMGNPSFYGGPNWVLSDRRHRKNGGGAGAWTASGYLEQTLHWAGWVTAAQAAVLFTPRVFWNGLTAGVNATEININIDLQYMGPN